MVFNTGAALLDAIVLAVVSREKEGTYGYKITQDVRTTIEVSESTLYPVLRRLQKDECLEVYDRQIDGRNRRYYKITVRGTAQLDLYRVEWKNYSVKINELFDQGNVRFSNIHNDRTGLVVCEHNAKRIIFSLMVWAHNVTSVIRQIVHTITLRCNMSRFVHAFDTQAV